VGPVRIDERLVTAAGQPVRLGAGEALSGGTRAQHAIARPFPPPRAPAGAPLPPVSLPARLSVAPPPRRVARGPAPGRGSGPPPRMRAKPASHEIWVLANAFNHMLDRLSAAFRQQRDFVADASHELRTPLAVISGQLDVLARYPDPSPEDVAHVQQIVGAEVA